MPRLFLTSREQKKKIKMPRAGIEPATRGFSVLCSTNWAIWAFGLWIVVYHRPYNSILIVWMQAIFMIFAKKEKIMLLFTHHYSVRCFGMNMPKSRDKIMLKPTLSCHQINFFHVFHIKLFKDSDGACVLKTAFECEIMDFLVSEI